MAGSEQSGIEAARRDLFDNAVCVVTPPRNTDKAALQLVYDFLEIARLFGEDARAAGAR